MRADYDSEAEALQIDLVDAVERGDYYDEDVVDGICTVGINNELAVSVELLSPRQNLEHLKTASERFDLDHEAVEAAARAAIAAPDRVVTLELSTRKLDSSGRIAAP